MKTIGIILLVFAALNFLVFVIGVSQGAVEQAGGKLGAALMLAVIGGYLVYRAKQKAKEKQEKDDWNK